MTRAGTAGWKCRSQRPILVLLPIFLLCSDVLRADANANCYLIVRYDDYFPRDEDARVQLGIEFEHRLFELFQSNNAQLVVGVVPFPSATAPSLVRNPKDANPNRDWLSRPDDPWVLLLRRYVEAGAVEPALHGYTHDQRTPPGHRPGEFATQSADWQLSSLREGRDAMSAALSRPIRVFVPPWNAWDAATSRALLELGFEWCSADFHHGNPADNALRSIPQCAADPAAVLPMLELEQPDGTVVVLTTHPFDFDDADGQRYFGDLQKLLAAIEADPVWRCVGFMELPDPTTVTNERLDRAIAWYQVRERAADTILMKEVVPDEAAAYYPMSWFAERITRLRVLFWSAIALTAGLAAMLVRLVARIALRGRAARVLASVAAIGALAFLAYGAQEIAGRGYHVRGIRWQAVAFASGAALTFLSLAMQRQTRPGAHSNNATPDAAAPAAGGEI